MQPKYLLDANVFIEAKNRYYPMDICPAFWDAIIWLAHKGVIRSLNCVYEEIVKGNDALANWVKKHRKILFIDTDLFALNQTPIIDNYIKKNNYPQSAIDIFYVAADFQLIAYGLAHKISIVSHEVSKQKSTKRIKIPDVCQGLGVPCMNTFELLRAEKIKFILEPIPQQLF